MGGGAIANGQLRDLQELRERGAACRNAESEGRRAREKGCRKGARAKEREGGRRRGVPEGRERRSREGRRTKLPGAMVKPWVGRMALPEVSCRWLARGAPPQAAGSMLMPRVRKADAAPPGLPLGGQSGVGGGQSGEGGRGGGTVWRGGGEPGAAGRKGMVAGKAKHMQQSCKVKWGAACSSGWREQGPSPAGNAERREEAEGEMWRGRQKAVGAAACQSETTPPYAAGTVPSDV